MQQGPKGPTGPTGTGPSQGSSKKKHEPDYAKEYMALLTERIVLPYEDLERLVHEYGKMFPYYLELESKAQIIALDHFNKQRELTPIEYDAIAQAAWFVAVMKHLNPEFESWMYFQHHLMKMIGE